MSSFVSPEPTSRKPSLPDGAIGECFRCRQPVTPRGECGCKDGICLICADCRDILPLLEPGSVDLVLTDPPYASGARTEAGKNSSGAMLRGQRWATKPIDNDQMTTHGFVWLLGYLSREWLRVLNDGGSALVFIDWRQWPNLLGVLESSNLRANGMVVWDKVSYGLGNGFRAQHELIAHVSRGMPRIVDRGFGNVLRHKREENSLHPAPKPVPLIHDLLRVCSGAGDLILDPFAGSGTTGRAAKDLGRRAILIEIESKYCDIAARRLEQEVLFT